MNHLESITVLVNVVKQIQPSLNATPALHAEISAAVKMQEIWIEDQKKNPTKRK